MSSGGDDATAPDGGAEGGSAGQQQQQQQQQQQPAVAGPPQAQRAPVAPSPQQQAQAQAQAQAAAMMRSDPAYIHGAALRAYRSNVRSPEGIYHDRLGQMVDMYRQIHDVGTGTAGGTASTGAAANAAKEADRSGRTNVPWQKEDESEEGQQQQQQQQQQQEAVGERKPKIPASKPPQSYGGRNIASVVVGRQLTPGGGRGRQNMAALQAMRDRTNDGGGGGGGGEVSLPKLVTSTVATEIRRFGEHCSATKFHWSYLSSTGDALARSSHHTNQLAAQAQVNNTNAAADRGHGAGGRGQRPSSSPIPPSYQPNRTGVTDILTAHTAPARPAVSTISLSFSPDGRTLASTHGDHTVKITCCATGRIVRNLEGHPRTPWTVKYHPVDSNIVASGCLGFQVRVWDWNYRPYNSSKNGGGGKATTTTMMTSSGSGSGRGRNKVQRPASPRAVVGGLEGGAGSGSGSSGGGAATNHDPLPPHCTDSDPTRYDYHLSRGVCLAMIRLQYAIISLSFHPSGHILAAASGSKVHLWDWDDVGGRMRREQQERRAARRMLRGDDGEGGEMMEEDDTHDQEQEQEQEGNTDADVLSTLPVSGSASRSEERQIGGSGGDLLEYGFTAALRCVHFPPSGRHVIIGGANPQQNPRGGGMSGGGMTFNLKLHEFDLAVALQGRSSEEQGAGQLLSNPRVLTDRALLYNDGGFDVSTDGTKMCACVEFWIEDGVDDKNALIAKEIESVQQDLRQYEDDAEDGKGNGDSDDEGRASTAATVSFSSPPRHGTFGSSSFRTPTSTQTNRQASGKFPSNYALDNPKTPPPAMIRSTVPQTPPSPPGRRNQPVVPSESEAGGGDAGAAASASTPPRTDRTDGTGRTVVPMPSLSRRQAVAGRRRRRDGRGYNDGPPPHRHGRSDDSTAEEGPDGEPIGGRWVPHVVTLSLSTSAPSYIPQSTCLLRHQFTRDLPIGNIIRACRLAGPKASGVTCVKFSPSADYCLLGYGVRENTQQGGDRSPHPVTAVYGSNRDHPSSDELAPQSRLVHVTTLRSSDDDVNIARFHPESGCGFVYGTKQGRVRVLSPRPWNYYYA